FEHAARGPDRVERIGLSARAALPAHAADLEHLLTLIGEEAGQAGAIGAGPLDRERPPPRRTPFCNTQSFRVAAAVRDHSTLDHHYPASHLDDTERVRVTVRINTNDEVQFVCKHP